MIKDKNHGKIWEKKVAVEDQETSHDPIKNLVT